MKRVSTKRTELEMILEIVQTQRATVLLLAGLVGKASLPELERKIQETLRDKWRETAAQLNTELKRCMDESNKTVDKGVKEIKKEIVDSLNMVKQEASLVVGKQRYWESAVGNLQMEVARLIQKAGGTTDQSVFTNGQFKG